MKRKSISISEPSFAFDIDNEKSKHNTLNENLEHGVDIVKRSVTSRSRSYASGGAEYLRKKKIRCISEDDSGYRTTCIKLYDIWGI